MMRPLTQWLDTFLFRPGAATHLGAVRLLFFGWLFAWYFSADFTFVAEYPPSFWTPVQALRLLALEQPSVETLASLQLVWKAALLLACVGLFTRSSIIVALVLGVYLLGLTHSFHKVNHSDGGLMLATFVLALSRCGDRWSLDSLIKAARQGSPQERPPLVGAEYQWPIRMVWVVWALIFFASGVSKVRNGGLSWTISDSMSNILVRNQINWEPPLGLGMQLAEVGWLCNVLAIGTVVFELGAIFVLCSRWARIIIVPGLLLMQVGIRLVMGDNFTQFMALYLFFIPIGAVGALVIARMPLRQQTVLYDGACGLCHRTIAVLRRIDVLGRLKIRDAVAEWSSLAQEHPTLNQSACLADMHVITADGDTHAGFYAYRSMAWVVPLLWPLLPVLYTPGVPWIGVRVYTWVAARRGRQACAMPPEYVAGANDSARTMQ